MIAETEYCRVYFTSRKEPFLDGRYLMSKVFPCEFSTVTYSNRAKACSGGK